MTPIRATEAPFHWCRGYAVRERASGHSCPTRKDDMNIKAMDIIMEYLESNGYNGVFNSDECACRILPPCGKLLECKAGYEHPGWLCHGLGVIKWRL